jgi:uncharacterized protein YciI
MKTKNLFAVFGVDKPDMGEVRGNARPSHRHYLRNHDHDVKVVMGGPTLDENSEKMNGTLLIIKANSLEDVRNYIDGDPYVKAGLFSEIFIRPWALGLGKEPTI